MSDVRKLRVLVLYAGENATQPRSELIAWLATTKSLNVEPTIVADDVPHSKGSIHDRVTRAINAADKAIAVVTLDDRSDFGGPNITEEIGRWLQGRDPETLCVVRQAGTEVNSNLNGLPYVPFKDRIKEAYEGIRKFLEAPLPASGGERPASGSTVVDASSTYVLLEGRLHRRLRVEDAEREVTAVLACDGPGEAALRSLHRRARVELTFGSHVIRGSLDDYRFTHEGDQQLATVVVSKRDQESSAGHMHDVAWGGGSDGPLSADEIAGLRASRLLTGEPKVKKSHMFGAEMFIRGGSHDGIAVDQSPIPEFLVTRPRGDSRTWEHLRLELVRQLILSRSVERIEHLRLTVEDGQLVHISFRGLRHQTYSNVAPHVVEVEQAVKF